MNDACSVKNAKQSVEQLRWFLINSIILPKNYVGHSLFSSLKYSGMVKADTRTTRVALLI